MHRSFIDTIDREGRFGEWVACAAMLVIGFVMLLPGDTMRFSEYWSLRAYGANEGLVIAFTLPAAVARMMILYINGMWRRTPFWRGIGATYGAGLFGGLSVLSLWPRVTGDVATFSVEPFFYLLFAAIEFRGAHRAGLDHKPHQLSS